MEFTTETLAKAKTAKTAEELLELAKAENIELTAEEAAKCFADLHKSGELADEELDNVAGGCGGPKVNYSYDVGDVLIKWGHTKYHTYKIIKRYYYSSFNTTWKYYPRYVLQNIWDGSEINVDEQVLGDYYEKLDRASNHESNLGGIK